MPSDLDRAIAQFRADIRALDAGAAKSIVQAYAQVWDRLQDDISRLTQRIQAVRDQGIEPTDTWLRRDARYRALLSQTEMEISRFAHVVNTVTLNGQRAAVEAALQHVQQLAEAAIGPGPEGIALTWDKLPTMAVQDLVGALQDGSPLTDLLNEMPGEAGDAMRSSLIEGLALGKNPRAMVAEAKHDLGGVTAVRALNIQRTETMRALRSATGREFEKNADVLEGWIWSCGGGACAVCYGEDGTLHDLDEEMDSHNSCRCTKVPRTKSWADLGYEDVPDERPDLPEPGEKFGALDDAAQLKVLGPAKYAAFKDGRIELSDLIEKTYSPKWGAGRQERSLQDALA